MALGEFEQMILLAVLHLGDDAYGVSIVDAIEERSGRPVSRGSLYVTFDRLEAKGYITSKLGLAGEARRGKQRRYITVTKKGLTALREARQALLGMWQGLEPILETTR